MVLPIGINDDRKLQCGIDDKYSIWISKICMVNENDFGFGDAKEMNHKEIFIELSKYL